MEHISDNQIAKVRPFIRAAWKRSEKYGVNRKVKACPVRDHEGRFSQRLASNHEMLSVGRKVIQTIYEFVKGSGFVAMLIDKNGVVLARLGDEYMLTRTSGIGCMPGYCWSEKVMGANAIGTSLALGEPVQFNGNDHWCYCASVGTCSSAPIRDLETGQVIGAVNLTGMMENLHAHTLGMVVAGAGWVENELSACHNAQKARLAEAQKSSIIEAVDNGVFAVSNSQHIWYMNHKAFSMLHIPSGEKTEGRPLKEILEPKLNAGFLKMLEQMNTVIDETITLWFGKERVSVVANIRSICHPDSPSIAGKVVALQETKRIKDIARKINQGIASVTFDDIIGDSAPFRKCLNKAMQVAKHSSNILLTGESGTGKDILAQAIHNSSKRAGCAFVALNCAAIPKELFASELFGYEEGAFTGARKGGAKGKFELASGGTLFLDEIGEMPLDLQAALLRVIEEKSLMRVGGQELLPVNVRIIAATHRNLDAMVADGKFRLDLYYRLNVVTIRVPTLRERKTDIPLLSEHLYHKINGRLEGNHIAGIDPEVIDRFMRYSWPGNIRELQNVIESSLCVCPGNTPVSVEMLPDAFSAPAQTAQSAKQSDVGGIKHMELSMIEEYLEKYAGNKAKTARALGISRSTLYRMLNRGDL